MIGQACTVRDCVANDNGSVGFFTHHGCTLINCAARQNGDVGFNVGEGGTLMGCSSSLNLGGGFQLFRGCVARNCSASENVSNGFTVQGSCVVEDCTATDNSEDGIDLKGKSNRIAQNSCNGNECAGIRLSNSQPLWNRVEGNHVTRNGTGIWVISTENILLGNSALSNTQNYDISAGNHYGAILASPGASFASANPWTNFSL